MRSGGGSPSPAGRRQPSPLSRSIRLVWRSTHWPKRYYGIFPNATPAARRAKLSKEKRRSRGTFGAARKPVERRRAQIRDGCGSGLEAAAYPPHRWHAAAPRRSCRRRSADGSERGSPKIGAAPPNRAVPCYNGIGSGGVHHRPVSGPPRDIPLIPDCGEDQPRWNNYPLSTTGAGIRNRGFTLNQGWIQERPAE